MASIHRDAFTQDRPWSRDEFADLLSSDLVALFSAPGGFALTRTIAGESELLTLAVARAFQRRGIARQLVESWLVAVSPQADTAFLEVAADNTAARALYAATGFVDAGRRSGYYKRESGPAVDALVLRCSLPLRHAAKYAGNRLESS
jgi:[ribosomal protein S18]-alanine N-acetyltransferase